MREAERAEGPAQAVPTASTPTTSTPAVARTAVAGSAARVLAVQRLAGNVAATALVTGRGPRPPGRTAGASAPRAATPTDLARAEHDAPAGTHAAHLGTPAAQAPPSGFQVIAGRRTQASLSGTAGLTLIQHSGAFTPPQWLPDARPRKAGNGTLWTPTVAPTQATDVTHDSLFLAAGDHDMFPAATNTEEVGGQTYRHVLRVTPAQSGLIQQGEQEHLNDAALAFALTYGAIANAINEVAALTLQPRSTREDAIAALVAELDARLPGLGTSPGGWPAILDRLLSASSQRDQSWHYAGLGTRRNVASSRLIVWPLDTSHLNLGVPSSQVVHL
ncbi:MAG TPA: hypothetical protein VKB69_01975 [Micromonosporaceae bacterium]|nr:hypothetical protein [Micromonosporaceae bacterium]